MIGYLPLLLEFSEPSVVDPLGVACSPGAVEVLEPTLSGQPAKSHGSTEQQPLKLFELQTYHCSGEVQVLSRGSLRSISMVVLTCILNDVTEGTQ